MGLATTQLFLAQGARVVAEDINPEIDKQFAGVANVAILVGDVSKEETAVEAVRLAQDRFGGLDASGTSQASTIAIADNAPKPSTCMKTRLVRQVSRHDGIGHYRVGKGPNRRTVFLLQTIPTFVNEVELSVDGGFSAIQYQWILASA